MTSGIVQNSPMPIGTVIPNLMRHLYSEAKCPQLGVSCLRGNVRNVVVSGTAAFAGGCGIAALMSSNRISTHGAGAARLILVVIGLQRSQARPSSVRANPRADARTLSPARQLRRVISTRLDPMAPSALRAVTTTSSAFHFGFAWGATLTTTAVTSCFGCTEQADSAKMYSRAWGIFIPQGSHQPLTSATGRKQPCTHLTPTHQSPPPSPHPAPTAHPHHAWSA